MIPIPAHSREVQELDNEIPVLFLVGLFCVFSFLVVVLGPTNVFEGELLGADSYTRLNRVAFVHEQGHWNSSIFPRSNAPYGESIHWTKPMDFLLLAGGKTLALVMPFSTGLHIWGVLISPLLHVVAFMGLAFLLRENLDRLGMILLAIIFLVQPILGSYFMIGRPDHHSLILAVFCWFLAGLYKDPFETFDWRKSIFIGSMGALGVWVSVEFLLPISFFLVASAVFWIWQRERHAVFIARIMAVMFLMATIFLLVERFPDDLFLIEYDKVSLPHCVLLGFVAMAWVGMSAFDLSSCLTSTILRRLIVVGSMGLVVSITQWCLFPDFFRGPLVGLDPKFKHLLWDNVAETQPLESSEAITNLGVGILAIPWVLYSLRHAKLAGSTYQGILLIAGGCFFVPLSMYESRWTPYASILLVIPYVTLVRRALEWAGTQWLNGRGEIGALIIGIVLLFWPVTVGTVLARGEPTLEFSARDGKCPLQPLGDYLRTDEFWAETSQTILAFQDFGPELLYRTNHRVIGTPMHRNQEGFRDMLSIMRAEDFATSRARVHERDIDLILICMQSNEEASVYKTHSEKANFYESLRGGDLPTWVEEVVLPNELKASFKLFQIVGVLDNGDTESHLSPGRRWRSETSGLFKKVRSARPQPFLRAERPDMT